MPSRPAANSSAGLIGKILEEQDVHRALEADAKMGDFALGQRDDLDAGEAQSLIDAGHVFLVAADPVQGLGQDDVEHAARSVGQGGLDTGPNEAGAGNGAIVVAPRSHAILLFGMFAAKPELTLDRGVPPIIRRIGT